MDHFLCKSLDAKNMQKSMLLGRIKWTLNKPSQFALMNATDENKINLQNQHLLKGAMDSGNCGRGGVVAVSFPASWWCYIQDRRVHFMNASFMGVPSVSWETGHDGSKLRGQ